MAEPSAWAMAEAAVYVRDWLADPTHFTATVDLARRLDAARLDIAAALEAVTAERDRLARSAAGWEADALRCHGNAEYHRSKRDALRDILAEIRQHFGDVVARDVVVDPLYDPAVLRLADSLGGGGYGAIMDAASRVWRASSDFPGGEFVVGPCRATMNGWIARIDAARLDGVRVGLEAGAERCDGTVWADAADEIRALDPAAVLDAAKEAT